jgi:hypothetical protein
MLVMHFMRPPDGCEITVLTVPEKPETLVYENIVYEEISKAIDRYAKSYPEQEIITVLQSNEQADDTRNGKDQKEKIIVFEEAPGLFVVMVFVQYPQDSMHDIFMCEPCNGFHRNKSCKGDQYFSKYHNDSIKLFI